MNKRSLTIFGLSAAVILNFSACKSKVSETSTSQATAATKPNIILIMSDDMGYSDLGVYGGEIDTPNLDALANTGVKFTQFYNTARCCPTRASLMTGLYPHQTGIGHMTNPPDSNADDLGLPAYRGFLNKSNMTIAEVLKENGYATLMTGKWHLGMAEQDQWPLQRGFDRFYGILAGASNYFKPNGNRGITVGNEQIEISNPDYYTTDAFTDNALQFIDESKAADADKPFFLYLAYTAPHWPIQAKKKDIDKYRDRYKKGWGALRAERYKRMLDLGLIDQSVELSEQDSRDWESLSPEKQEEMALRRAIYAAQVDRMDQNIGKLIQHLDKKGLRDNTIIVFLDDNGACAEGGMLGGGPADQLETLEGYFLTYGQAWANASNTPFRKYKHWLHEGGISSPLIINWKGKISPAQQGKTINQYGFLPDIMATFVDVTNANYPAEFKGNSIPVLEGQSLLPLLGGSNNEVHKAPIFWEHEGNKAVRLGEYKLVMEWKRENNNWELYNIDKDRSETNDLATVYPEKVSELSHMWEQWAKEKGVEEWDKILELQKRK